MFFPLQKFFFLQATFSFSLVVLFLQLFSFTVCISIHDYLSSSEFLILIDSALS